MELQTSLVSAPVIDRIHSQYAQLTSGESTAGGEDTATVLPHYVYTLGLDDLTLPAGVKTPEPKQGPLRLVVLSGGEPVGSIESDSDGSVSQVSLHQDHARQSYELLESYLAENEAVGGSVELRILRVPALHFQAIWLYDPDGAGSVIPFGHVVPGLVAGRTYSYDGAISQLKQAASQLSYAEDTLGN